MSQTWSYMLSYIDATVLDKVLHVTTYIDANVPDVVLHENTYQKFYVMTYVS
ncbi:hypothetical protein F383_24405 [Gossypium arboreum]|uniref:Uncharacterized protein n=1 Tax=Gossypium arboreum TaxID=29729 RepID=A0A0B0NS87_GOSAR|nr:hypothetical protein F383_05637 [Gossypium arboreum]KHG19047.1 hypothetical protein F383_24405 [Gossypium arboreum]